MSRGKSRGLCRHRCKSCGRTFGALAGTALSGLRCKERWLSFAASLAKGETVREAARCAAGLYRARRFAGGGAPLSCPLPALDANSVKQALAPVIASDALLASDAGRCNRSADERVRGVRHIQTATSHHSQFKGFLRPFRRDATKDLDSCLRWFHLVVLGKPPAPRACRASARTCLRIAN